MLELLFYTTLTCTQTDAIMLKIEANPNLSNLLKVELVETLKDSAPECEWYWDANDPRNGKHGSSETREG